MESDWQHKFNGLKERNLHLLKAEMFVDCHFLVGDSQQNQKTIAGHKLILTIASPVFERMFYGQLADKNDPIVIPDIQPDIFQSMLEHIYSDCINVVSMDMAFQLYSAAKKYMLRQLLGECTLYINYHLSPKNVCQAYEFAEFYEEAGLKQNSLKFIIDRTKEVLTGSSFVNIQMSTLIVIMDQQKLQIDSELDLFYAILRLANHKGLLRDTSMLNAKDSSNHNSTESTNGSLNSNVSEQKEVVLKSLTSSNLQDQCSMDNIYSTNGENLLKEAVKKIRFLSLTPEQFSLGPARSKLLENCEIKDIFIKICSPINDSFPMPVGFCSSRNIRKNLPSYYCTYCLAQHKGGTKIYPCCKEENY